MKKRILLLLSLILVFANLVTPVSAAAKEYYEYQVPYTATEPTVDGELTDDAWNQAGWTEITYAIEDVPAWGDVPAKFKVLHNGQYLYFAAEVMDDTPTQWDSIILYFSDVRTEDPRLGPNNIITFKRQNTEFSLGTDTGTNGNFGAPKREGDNLVSVVAWEMKMITDDSDAPIGYVVEAKIEYLVTFPERIFFNAGWSNDEPGYSGNSAWSPYWSWNLLWMSTTCYGELVFLAEGVTPEGSAAPGGPAAPETSEIPESSEAPNTTEAPDNSDTAGDTTAPVTTEPSINETNDDSDSSEKSPLLWIVLAAVVVVVAVVVVALKLRKKS